MKEIYFGLHNDCYTWDASDPDDVRRFEYLRTYGAKRDLDVDNAEQFGMILQAFFQEEWIKAKDDKDVVALLKRYGIADDKTDSKS